MNPLWILALGSAGISLVVCYAIWVRLREQMTVASLRNLSELLRIRAEQMGITDTEEYRQLQQGVENAITAIPYMSIGAAILLPDHHAEMTGTAVEPPVSNKEQLEIATRSAIASIYLHYITRCQLRGLLLPLVVGSYKSATEHFRRLINATDFSTFDAESVFGQKKHV